jgi:hypothetical protein
MPLPQNDSRLLSSVTFQVRNLEHQWSARFRCEEHYEPYWQVVMMTPVTVEEYVGPPLPSLLPETAKRRGSLVFFLGS